jgi:hypothetical protein
MTPIKYIVLLTLFLLTVSAKSQATLNSGTSTSLSGMGTDLTRFLSGIAENRDTGKDAILEAFIIPRPVARPKLTPSVSRLDNLRPIVRKSSLSSPVAIPTVSPVTVDSRLLQPLKNPKAAKKAQLHGLTLQRELAW